ncbi:MAG: beta-glucosidase [Acidimicrobiia bacterium]|nr:beta-glucosidase [Acidimicrobiia bacterium]
MSSDFTWGVSTSAFQIEGATHADDRGESIWDRFHAEGHMPDGGEPATDHYHRYQEDIALMGELGVGGYRFSIAWPRVMPDGKTINPAGLDFYDRLVDELLAAGIAPWPTLYHWDLPIAVQDRGGWPHRDTVGRFMDYTAAVVDRLGDRVGHWITQNEPWVSAMLGHRDGYFAPGIADWKLALRAGHHLLLSHGRATEVIRELGGESQVGIALDCRAGYPASDSAEDIDAASHFDGFRNRWFFDPVHGKGYPEDMVEAYAEAGRFEGDPLDFVQSDDMEVIATPTDFTGINYYTSLAVNTANKEREVAESEPGPNPAPGYTEMGWAITPEWLTKFLVRVNEDYGPSSIVITENGASYSDGPDETGKINDQRRIDYLDAHIAAVGDARGQGVPITGYFEWSLLDNLEWVAGYGQRFGIVHVDFETMTRTPKASYHWYRDRIDQGL